jgi:hypothetical protein
VTDAWGWIAIVAVPLAFWMLILIFMVMVFGGRKTSEPLDVVDAVHAVHAAVEATEPVAVPLRESAAAPSGLGWRPPVPSHH